jgi:predicted TIM-barrel fold metal-dependent hydrolase
MNIVDSQIHLWGADTPERPWNTATGSVMHGPAEFTSASALAAMDAAGVDAAMIVPPSFEGDRNDVALEAVHKHPTRFRAHGRFDMAAADARETISTGLLDSGLRGVRLTFNGLAARWIQDDTLEWLWDFASEQGIAISLHPRGEQLQMLGPICDRHPRLKLSIDNLAAGVPDTGFDTMERINQLEPLASRPNIAIKTGAFPVSFPTTYSPAVVRRVVDDLLSWYGPDRIFWGSDFTRYPTEDYADTLEVFLAGIAHLSPREQSLIMGEALREWFDWPL